MTLNYRDINIPKNRNTFFECANNASLYNFEATLQKPYNLSHEYEIGLNTVHKIIFLNSCFIIKGGKNLAKWNYNNFKKFKEFSDANRKKFNIMTISEKKDFSVKKNLFVMNIIKYIFPECFPDYDLFTSTDTKKQYIGTKFMENYRDWRYFAKSQNKLKIFNLGYCAVIAYLLKIGDLRKDNWGLKAENGYLYATLLDVDISLFSDGTKEKYSRLWDKKYTINNPEDLLKIVFEESRSGFELRDIANMEDINDYIKDKNDIFSETVEHEFLLSTITNEVHKGIVFINEIAKTNVFDKIATKYLEEYPEIKKHYIELLKSRAYNIYCSTKDSRDIFNEKAELKNIESPSKHKNNSRTLVADDDVVDVKVLEEDFLEFFPTQRKTSADKSLAEFIRDSDNCGYSKRYKL